MTNYLEVKNLSKSFDSFQLHNIRGTVKIIGLQTRKRNMYNFRVIPP